MALFEYKAVNAGGEVSEGELEAADEASLVRQLQADGLIPVRVHPVRTGLKLSLKPARKAGAKIGQKQITLLTRELASLLESGLTLDRSLQILLDLTDEPQLHQLLSRLQDKMRGGATFSAALEEQGNLFSRLYINMVRAGEAGGAMQAVMQRLADYLERSAELRESIKSALIYPLILVAVAGLSVALLLVFVVPQFAQMFEDMGKALPLPTQIVIGAGNLLSGYWWLLLALGYGGYRLFRQRLRQPEVRRAWDRRLLAMPLAGELIVKVETARFSRTLSTLVENGVSLLKALSLVKDVISNRIIAEAIEAAADQLSRGKSLSEPLLEQGVFPRLALQMMKVGEESGQLEAMLGKVADMYDQEVRATVQRMLALLEPLLIVGLGVVVAGIIMSILVAIMSVNQLAI
jgi:general secretion pathway protein F